MNDSDAEQSLVAEAPVLLETLMESAKNPKRRQGFGIGGPSFSTNDLVSSLWGRDLGRTLSL